MNKSNRHKIRKLILIAAVLFMIGRYAASRPLPDFIEYWSAAHLFAAQQDPYSILADFRIQHSLGWQDPIPLPFMNPPWMLPLIFPLGLVKSFRIAWLVWVSLLAAIVFYAAKLLSSVYPVDRKLTNAQELLPFTFLPCLVSLKYAQITPLVLLGVAGFLAANSRKKPFLAGAFLALTSFKPHLLFLVWLGVLLDLWWQRNWKVIAGALLVIVLLTAAAVALDYQVLNEYWESARLFAVYPAAGGAILRALLNSGNALLQFGPTAVGFLWFLDYWKNHRLYWDWPEQMPIVLTVSMLTTAYGWVFDDTLLVLVFVALFSHWGGRVPRKAILLYTALNFALLLLLILAKRAPIAAAFAFLIAPAVTVFVLRRTLYLVRKPSPEMAFAMESEEKSDCL